MQAIEHLEDYKWEHPPHYGGHSPDGDYCVATLTRDSDLLVESNWYAMRKIVEKHSPILTDFNGDAPSSPYDFRASHWACGWVEYLIIPASAPEELLEEVAEALCSLVDYPVLDESDWSERECEAAQNYWVRANIRERVEMLKSTNVSIFAARRDWIPQDDCGRIQEQCLGY